MTIWVELPILRHICVIDQSKQLAKRLGIKVIQINAEVSDVIPLGKEYLVEMKDRSSIKINFLILWTGSLDATNFAHLSQYDNFFNSPYADEIRFSKISLNSTCGIIGSSLSAVDAILMLQQQGHS